MDIAVLLAVALGGFTNANISVVVVCASVLTMLSAKRKFEIARRYPDVGVSRVLAGALFLSLANNTVFTLLSYLVGRAATLLV